MALVNSLLALGLVDAHGSLTEINESNRQKLSDLMGTRTDCDQPDHFFDDAVNAINQLQKEQADILTKFKLKDKSNPMKKMKSLQQVVANRLGTRAQFESKLGHAGFKNAGEMSDITQSLREEQKREAKLYQGLNLDDDNLIEGSFNLHPGDIVRLLKEQMGN